ncbi:MAG: Ig-like domain-containing protein, partial [Chloroflexota bacterium]
FNAGGLVLAGTDDYVSVPDAPSLNPAAVTVEAWAKFDSLADRPHLVGKGTGSQGAYWLVVETNGTPRFFYTKSGETWSAVNGAAGDIVPGAWYHFAGVYDGTNATIYVNGVAKGTVVNAGTLATTDPNPVWFGRNSGGTDSFAGMLDEVRIWNVARTAAELQAAMNTPLTGAEAGLAGYWRLDEGAGLTAVDRTTNGNDGSLVNGPTWASAVAPAFNSDSFIYQADDGNGATALATVSITVTNAAPTVSISAPADSAPVTGMVAITATAADDNSVSQVEFFVDGVSIGLGADMGGGTWSINWDTSGVISPPTHSLTAVATDVTARSTTSAPAVVTVTNAAPTAVSITSPVDLATVTGMVTITATATDDNAVTQVEFFADAVSIGVDTNGLDGWSVNWDTSALADLSTHSLTAVASDAAAQTGNSAAVSVTVSNLAPTVSITAPDGLTPVAPSATTTISATAGDDNAVTQVEFFVDDGVTTTLLGVDTDGSDGWSVNWDTSAVASPTTYSLTAVASDAAQSTTSAAVSVTVQP